MLKLTAALKTSHRAYARSETPDDLVHRILTRDPSPADHRKRKERAHHKDLAVGEVDELDDGIDHRVAERDQRDQRAVGEPDDR